MKGYRNGDVLSTYFVHYLVPEFDGTGRFSIKTQYIEAWNLQDVHNTAEEKFGSNNVLHVQRVLNR